jgi:hypothetical protein
MRFSVVWRLELTLRRVCSAVIAAELVSRLELMFDVPLKTI